MCPRLIFYFLAGALFSGCLVAEAPPEPVVIAHVVRCRGSWADRSSSDSGRDLCKTRAAAVYDSSVIQRPDRGRKDSDFIEVQPDAPGSDLVRFRCDVQAACLGPLNLKRIPIARTYPPYAQWLQSVLNASGQSRSKEVRLKLTALIQKGANENSLLRDGVLLLDGSTLAHPEELFAKPLNDKILVEFCTVGPAEACTGIASPTAWIPSRAPTLSLRPGFYKVVIDQLAEASNRSAPAQYLRTSDQAYVLLTAVPLRYEQLHADFETARRAAFATTSEDSYANLIAYLDAMAMAQ